MGCVKDSTIQEVVSQIQTSTALSADQKNQIIEIMRAKVAGTPQKAKLEKALAEVYTVTRGTIYDSNLRSETQSHKGSTIVSGKTSNPYVGHNTQRYPDNIRVSQDSPGGAGFHWTNKNLDPSDPEYHDKPADADRNSVDRTHISIDDDGNISIK